MIDKLNKIFELQRELQVRVGTFEKIKDNPAMKQQFINQMILAIQEETVEVMRESAYKNPAFVPFGWKKNQVGNNEKFKEELVDMLHFFVNLCIISGMTADELFEKYINKNKENHVRQDNGY